MDQITTETSVDFDLTGLAPNAEYKLQASLDGTFADGNEVGADFINRPAQRDIDTLAAAGNDEPYGPWSDGTTMWVTDWVDEKLYAYVLATGERDADKDFDTLAAAGNTIPQGIWSDGVTMWVADNSDNKLFAYTLATGVTGLRKGHRHPGGRWEPQPLRPLVGRHDHVGDGLGRREALRLRAGDRGAGRKQGLRHPGGGQEQHPEWHLVGRRDHVGG